MPDIEKCRAFLFYYLQKPYFRGKVFQNEESLSIIFSINRPFACSEKKTDSISLNGEIKGLGNDTIYLYGSDRMYDRMDTLIVENDKFSTTLSVDTLVSTILLFSDGTEYPLFLDKGHKIQIKGSELSCPHCKSAVMLLTKI